MGSRARDRRTLRRIFGSLLWLLGERGLQLAVQLVVGLWVIRYLRPTRFGLLSYCLAFAFLVQHGRARGARVGRDPRLGARGSSAGRIMAGALLVRLTSSLAVGA